MLRPEVAAQGARRAGPEEMAACLLHGVVKAQRANVDVPLAFRLAFLVQVMAVPPDPRCGLGELRGR